MTINELFGKLNFLLYGYNLSHANSKHKRKTLFLHAINIHSE